VKERLEPIEGAWASFIVEFVNRENIGDTEVRHPRIVFLCPRSEQNPRELCFAFFGPQIKLETVNPDRGNAELEPQLVFVYAAQIPENMKASLEYVQRRYDAPVLVAQRSNVQQSARHVVDYLQMLAAPLPPVTGEEQQGLLPGGTDETIWQGSLPEVVLEGAGDEGRDVHANTDIQDYRAEYACRYVLKHFASAINRDHMAEMVNLSPGYFSNLFRLEVGMSFSDYVIQVRVDNAKKLLRRFDLSVEQVSRQCGFNSLAHFSRTFKDRTGLSPLKFRKAPKVEV